MSTCFLISRPICIVDCLPRNSTRQMNALVHIFTFLCHRSVKKRETIQHRSFIRKSGDFYFLVLQQQCDTTVHTINSTYIIEASECTFIIDSNPFCMVRNPFTLVAAGFFFRSVISIGVCWFVDRDKVSLSPSICSRRANWYRWSTSLQVVGFWLIDLMIYLKLRRK